MKYKYGWLIGLLLTFSFNLVASDLTIEQYETLSKKFISEVIITSMNAYEVTKSGLSDIEEKGRQEFLKRFYKKGNWNKEQIDSILDDGWPGTRNNLFSAYCSRIAVDSTSYKDLMFYKHPNLSLEYYTNVENVRIDYLGEHIKLLNKALVIVVEDKNKLSEEKLAVSNHNYAEGKSNKMIGKSDIFKFAIVLLLIFAIAYLLYVNFKQRKRITHLNQKLAKTKRELENERWKTPSSKKEHQNISKPNINKDNSERYKPKSQLEQTEEKPAIKKTIDFEVINKPKIKEPQFESKTFYFETFKEGYFLVDDGKLSKEVWDVYKITTTQEGKGVLDLVTDKPEELIPNKDAYLIKELCDVSFDSGGVRDKFKNTESGIVRKEGQQWIVEKKVKIVII